MLEVFRNWISSILGVGILFTVIKIILPNTNLKKYIYSLIGIVTIIVIIKPLISFFEDNELNSIKNIFLNATDELSTSNINYTDISNYEDVNKNNVKENFKANLEEDLKEKLAKNMENDVKIDIQIADTYDIEKINITIYGDTSFDVLSYVSNEYDVEKDKINVKKEE